MTALEAAIDGWRQRLGAAHVQQSAPPPGTVPGGHAPAASIRPANREEVQQALAIAREHHIPLHPVSRGCNWGYSDGAVPQAGAVLLDLSRLDRILHIDAQLGYAIIESGVTQGALAAAVAAQAPGFALDCTGAGPGASVAGNALERGFGHTPYADHFRSMCALEVVLADGSVLETGFGRLGPARAANVYPYGLGPVLDGLFSQSGLGVITRMTVWLWPRPEAFRFFYVAYDGERVAPLIDALRPLRLQGLLNSAVHIGNDLRLITSARRYPWEEARGAVPLPPELRARLRGEAGLTRWNAGGAITGSRGQVRDAARALRRAVRPLGGRVIFIDETRLRWGRRILRLLESLGRGKVLRRQLHALESNYGLLQGRPTEEPLRAVYWRLRNPPQNTPDPGGIGCGLLWISPVIPLVGEDATRVLALVAPVLERHGFDTPVTITMLNERSAVCVFNISFDRSLPEEEQAALAAYEEAMRALAAAGYYPYRSGFHAEQMLARGDQPYERALLRIRDALDAENALAARWSPFV